MGSIQGYKLIPFEIKYQEQLINFIDLGYKSIGYNHLEVEGLDNDLLEILKVYASPSCFMLLLDDERIIGSVAIKIKGSEAWLKRVFVDENYRGQSLGKKLSKWAFDYARSQGADLMHIWSGTKCLGAHQLYLKLGAQDLGETRYLGGIDETEEFHFVKSLSV